MSPEWLSYDKQNQEMVDGFTNLAIISTKEVELAFRNINRAAFVSTELLPDAFRDAPIKGFPGIHMSAPHMYASILEELELEPGLSFLNIGSGTGYFSCLAGYLIKQQGVNHGIELNENLVEFATNKVKSFLEHRTNSHKDICHPTFIAGNCFLLDPHQNKYDRLYVGGACAPSSITFFLEFLKVGGFLVAPVGGKLVKLERVSYNKGVKTVINDVCFAALTRLDPRQLARKCDGTIPLLKFPQADKRKKPKKAIFIKANFPVSNSAARKKLSRLRAIQHALDSMDKDASIPLPFCYCPQLEQINLYKHLKKSNKNVMCTCVSERKVPLSNDLITVEEFFLSSSLSTEDIGSTSKCECRDSVPSTTPSTLWEHLCTDKLWETVVDYYYSLCATNDSRRTSCFQLHGVIDPQTLKFKNELFKLKKPKKSSSKTQKSCIAQNKDKSSSSVSQDVRLCLENMLKEVCQSVETKNTKNKNYFSVHTDFESSKKMSKMEEGKWSRAHDIELISFLISLAKTTSTNIRDHIPKVITSELFDPSSFLKYPLLSSVDERCLAYRCIALLRLASVVDSVLELLVGNSIDHNQFPVGNSIDHNQLLVGNSIDHNKHQEKMPLPSFSEDSFCGSDQKANIMEVRSAEKRAIEKDVRQATAEEEEIVKEIQSSLNSVNESEKSLSQQLKLIEDIEVGLKEQVHLLNQQIRLLEEQQELMVDNQSLFTEEAVERQKSRKQTLLDTRDRANAQLNMGAIKKNNLLERLEQVFALETKLNRELSCIQERGMDYLRDPKSLMNLSIEECSSQESLIKNTDVKTFSTSEPKQKFRYQPQLILPRCRFLLPLSRKRYPFIREMLRSSEAGAPKQRPVISVDRRVPLNERHLQGGSVFTQIFYAVFPRRLTFRWNKKQCDQWWEVKFSGEGILDQGGGFRESLAEISEELCPSNGNVKSPVDLFIKTANQTSGTGSYTDCYTLNPACEKLDLYYWVGQLMGACFRTDEALPMSLAPYVWKLLIGEHVTWEQDFSTVDQSAIKNLDWLENVNNADAFLGLNIDQTFTTVLSDGTTKELVHDGEKKLVTWDNRKKFCRLARKARLFENVQQVVALRNGLLSVIPAAVLSCLTWCNLEKSICGDPTIPISNLMANCLYRADLKPTNECVIHMWTALHEFTHEERSRFLRFITGRRRLPSPFIVSKSLVKIDSLPSASTCCTNLFLPEYSSAQVCEQKLRYAIYNCVAIDTDTNPW